MKKSLNLILIGLFVISIFACVLVSANFLENWKSSNLDDGTLKYFVLILIAIIIFSVLGAMDFPESGALRFLLAIVVSFFATYMINTSDILAVLTSYTGLGLSLSIFIPIIIMVFVSLTMAKKGNVFGMYSSVILWLVYSIYVFFKGIAILSTLSKDTTFPGSVFFSKISEFVTPFLSGEMASEVLQIDFIWGFILIGVGIASFVFGVLNVGNWEGWMRKKLSDAQRDIFADRAENLKHLLNTSTDIVTGKK